MHKMYGYIEISVINGTFEHKLDWHTRAKKLSVPKLIGYLRSGMEIHLFALCK